MSIFQFCFCLLLGYTLYMLPRPIFHYFIVLYLLHIYYLHKSTATWRFFTISNLLGTGQIPRKIQAFGPKEKKLVVKDKCVHKSENQPGRVSRVWWRGRDSWMDRWTIWYLDGVTAYLDSYRYLCILRMCSIGPVILLQSRRWWYYSLSSYQTIAVQDLHHKYMFVWWWFACITSYANNCICLFVLIKGERYLDVTLTKSSGFEYCNLGMQYTWLRLLLVTWPPRISKTGHLQLRSVPSGSTALHQPALTYIFYTELLLARTGLIVDKLWCGVLW